jgi:hypothetical protein
MRLSETSVEKTADNKVEPASKPIYTVLAVYMPLSIVFSAGILSVKIFLFFKPALFISFPAVILVSLISCLAASLYFSLIKNVQSGHSAADLRCALVTMLTGYSLSSLFVFSLPLGRRFFPALTNVVSTLSALYCWASVLSIKNMLHARALFESYTSRYSGDKLQSAMLEDAPRMSVALEQFKQTRRIYIFELFVVAALSLALNILPIPFDPVLFVLFLLLIVNACLIFTLLGLFIREHYFAGEGIAVSTGNRYKRLFGAALFSLGAVLCALLFARDDSLLPFSALLNFIALILGFLSRFFNPAEIDMSAMERFPPNPSGMVNAMIPDIQETEPWPFWEQFWTWLRYAFISAAALGFVWFMIKPFFARLGIAKTTAAFLKNFRFFLRKWFGSLKLDMLNFITGLKTRNPSVKIRKDNIEELSRISGGLLEGLSPEKKRKLKANVSLFSRLILWGTETTGLTWKPSNAPGEYCTLLAERAAVFNVSDAVIQCGVLFEKALYARNPLSAEEQREFKTLIGRITATITN